MHLGINLSPANNNLFTISFILYLYRILPIRRILLKGELGPNNNPLVSCCLTISIIYYLKPNSLIKVSFFHF